MIPAQYRANIRAVLVDLRKEFGGDRERTSAFLIRNIALFTGPALAEVIAIQALKELNDPSLDFPALGAAVPGDSTPTVPVTQLGPLQDPAGYTEASVSANASSEECSIEPHTGLMVRYLVWRPGFGTYWLLSSLGEGHVRREGNTLIAENFTKNGQYIEVVGFLDYEPQANDQIGDYRYVAKGNTCPYDGSRRYIVVQCHAQ